MNTKGENYMKKLKSIVSLTLVIIVILSAATLAGCYKISSGKMKYVVGTYKLISYSDRVDRIAQDGIELYIVIRSDGTGYYGYKDNNTAARIEPLRCRYTEDTEEPGKYSYVEIDFTGDGKYETLGIYSKLFEKKLNANTPVWKGSILNGTAEVDYRIYVEFERVSNSTDTSYIEKHLK